jgi:hypothetical protein
MSDLGDTTENENSGPAAGRFGALREQIFQGGQGAPDLDTTAGGLNKLPEDQRVKPEDLGINPPFEPQQGPDIHDRLIDARLNGHSWGDIQSHMAAHYDNGGTREQLGFAPAEGLMARLDGQHSQNMQVAMADDPVTGYGSMIPGVGGTGDIQRNAASMGGGFGPRASLGKYTQTPEGLHNYQINQGGQPTGFVEFTKQGNVARVENIAVEGRAGGLGAGETRAMARRFFSDHPEIDTIGGRHVSGSQAPHEITFSRQQLLGPGE